MSTTYSPAVRQKTMSFPCGASYAYIKEQLISALLKGEISESHIVSAMIEGPLIVGPAGKQTFTLTAHLESETLNGQD